MDEVHKTILHECRKELLFQSCTEHLGRRIIWRKPKQIPEVRTCFFFGLAACDTQPQRDFPRMPTHDAMVKNLLEVSQEELVKVSQKKLFKEVLEVFLYLEQTSEEILVDMNKLSRFDSTTRH